MIISSVPYHNFNYVGATFAIYHVNKGEGLNMHEHNYSHATVCHVGSCVVRVKGKEIVMTKETQPINLPANIPHEIEALEDNTVFVNVFAEGKY
jgi:quercetin dioxygenase-like cupin family protein